MMWSAGGGALKRVQIFILARGLKNVFLTLSGRESSLVQTFCESCKQLDITYISTCPHDSEICDSRLSYLNKSLCASGSLVVGRVCVRDILFLLWCSNSSCTVSCMYCHNVLYHARFPLSCTHSNTRPNIYTCTNAPSMLM